MKTLKMKNKHIAPIYNALDAITVDGFKVKRGKGKLQNNLKAKHQEYQEDLTQINEKYFQKDKEGDFKSEGNNLVWLDEYRNDYEKQKEADEAFKELLDEEVIINLVEYETKIKSFYEALEKDEFTAGEQMKDDDFELMVEMLEDAFENNKKDDDEDGEE